MARILIGVAALSLLAADSPPTPFDLVCSGSETSELPGFGRYAPAPSRSEKVRRFRIDLLAQKWCEDVCNSTRPINAVTPSDLTLENGLVEAGRVKHIIINRESGRLVLSDESELFIFRMIGFCAVGPFSGFPAAKF